MEQNEPSKLGQSQYVKSEVKRIATAKHNIWLAAAVGAFAMIVTGVLVVAANPEIGEKIANLELRGLFSRAGSTKCYGYGYACQPTVTLGGRVQQTNSYGYQAPFSFGTLYVNQGDRIEMVWSSNNVTTCVATPPRWTNQQGTYLPPTLVNRPMMKDEVFGVSCYNRVGNSEKRVVQASLKVVVKRDVQHGVGANIRTADGTLWMITNNKQRRPYSSIGAFLSYGFNSLSAVEEATKSDLQLSVGPFIVPQDGAVFMSNVNNATAYFLVTGGKRARFASAQVFTGQGFSEKNAIASDITYLPSATAINSATERHRPGVVIDNGGQVMFVAADGLYSFASIDAFNSWGLSFAKVVPANAADKKLKVLGIVNARQPGQLDIASSLAAQ